MPMMASCGIRARRLRIVAKIAAPWAPYRTIGSWYMWRVLELDAA